MAERLGRVVYDDREGWRVEFRSVRWPGERRARRVRIYSSPGVGRIDSEHIAKKVLLQIRAELAAGKPLHAVLGWYVSAKSAQNRWVLRWERYCDEKAQKVRVGKLAPRRLSELRAYIRRGYFDFFDERDIGIHEVTAETLIQWIAWFREQKRRVRGQPKPRELSEKTIKNVLGDVAAFLRRLRTQGSLVEVPHIPYEELEVEEYDPQIPDRDTVFRVLQAIPIARAGLFLARSTMGFRPSEARRLNVSDLKLGRDDDLTDAHIALPASKSKKRRPRKLELSSLLRLWLRHPDVETTFGRLEDRWGGEPLFPNPLASGKDLRWTETSEKRTLYRAYRNAGVTHIRPNEMGRHFFATDLVNAGADMFAVKEWLGHRDVSTTERYAKLRPQTIARALRHRTP